MILTENDVLKAWLQDRQVKRAVFSDPDPINIYNDWCFAQDVDAQIEVKDEYIGDSYVEHCTNVDNWNMPQEYKDMDIHQYLLEKLPNVNKISTEYKRMMMEYAMFEERGMIPVLKFLKYMVDTCKENNIILGVGRGSSVASYCLYLLGVHKINSLKYNLDIKEFLK